MLSKHIVMFGITTSVQNKHVLRAPVNGTLICTSVQVVFKVCQRVCLDSLPKISYSECSLNPSEV